MEFLPRLWNYRIGIIFFHRTFGIYSKDLQTINQQFMHGWTVNGSHLIPFLLWIIKSSLCLWASKKLLYRWMLSGPSKFMHGIIKIVLFFFGSENCTILGYVFSVYIHMTFVSCYYCSYRVRVNSFFLMDWHDTTR